MRDAATAQARNVRLRGGAKSGRMMLAFVARAAIARLPESWMAWLHSRYLCSFTSGLRHGNGQRILAADAACRQ